MNTINHNQKCDYCKSNEVAFKAPDLKLKNFCSKQCTKLESIKELSKPETSAESFTNVFRI